MDPLSIAGSVAGLVTLADAVFRLLSRYRKEVKGAEGEIKSLMAEVKNISILLHNLMLLASDLESSSSAIGCSASHFQPHYLHECQRILRRIQKDLSEVVNDVGSSSRLGRLHACLKWPFSSYQIKAMLEDLRKHQQLINVALTAESIAHLKEGLSRQQQSIDGMGELKEATKAVLEIQTTITVDQKRQKVLDFFLRANPQSEFEMSKKLRHPLTGLWLTQGDDFREWYETPNAKIWLTGIPGSGKSVMAGAIISECFLRIQLNAGGRCQKVAVAYFFCTYRDPITIESTAILSAIAVQLARQNEKAYNALETYYEELRGRQSLPSDPTVNGIVIALREMFAQFDQTYLVVDGLDECGDQVEDSVKILGSLAPENNSAHEHRVNVALLSRDEFIIRTELEAHFDLVEIEAHTEDLQLYVAAELEERIASRKLRIRDINLKDHILSQLVNEAKGMFRWVVCQLDHLCELPTDRARREALRALPPTLPATYERILAKIDGYNDAIKCFVQNVFLVIAFDSSVETRVVCEAASINPTSNTLFDDEIVDEAEVLRWCGSLVRKSNSGNGIEFAHFTVKEFLEGSCAHHPQFTRYSVCNNAAHARLALLCLRYLKLENFADHAPEANSTTIWHIEKRLNARPFYEFAAMNLPRLLHQGIDEIDACIFSLLKELFNLEKPATFHSWTIELIRHFLVPESNFLTFRPRNRFGCDLKTALSCIEAVLRPDFSPLHLASALSLTDLCIHLLSTGVDVNMRSRFGTPLHCATGGVMVFTNSEDWNSKCDIVPQRRASRAKHATVQVLLKAGAMMDLAFHSPFRNSSTLRLSIESLTAAEDPAVMVELIEAGISLEEKDMEAIDIFCKERIEVYQRTSDHISDDKAITRVIGALERRSERGDDYSKMFYPVLRMVWQMKNTDTMKHLSDDNIPKVLSVIIENNHAPELRRLLHLNLSDDIRDIMLYDEHFEENEVMGLTLLHFAVLTRSLDVLKVLLEVGCDPNKRSTDGRIPLHLCCHDYDIDMLKTLLEGGASPLMCTADGENLWHLSAKENSTGVLRVLIHLPNMKHMMEQTANNKDTPVCAGLREQSLEAVLLLEPFCNSKAAWSSGQSVFRNAARLGSFTVLTKLLEVGVSIDDPCETNGSAFEEFVLGALESKGWVNPDIWQALLAFQTPVSPDRALAIWDFMASTALPKAAFSKWPFEQDWVLEVFLRLLQIGIAEIYEAKTMAAAFLPICEALSKMTDRLTDTLRIERLEASSDDTHLWDATTFSFRRLEDWNLLSKAVQAVLEETELLDKHLTDPSMMTLLQECVIHNDGTLLRLLLEAGVNVHCRERGLSAFEIACFPHTRISHENFIYLLQYVRRDQIMAGNPDLQGCGPLHFTIGVPQRLRQLICLDICCDLPNSHKLGTPLIHHLQQGSITTAKVLLESGANPWLIRPTDGANAVMIAVAASQSNLLIDLVLAVKRQKKHVAKWHHTLSLNIGREIHHGVTALHLGAMLGNVLNLNTLLETGHFEDMDTKDDRGKTPMHYAAWFGHAEIIHVLAKKGGNIDAQSKLGLTALHHAAWANKLTCIEALLELGAKQLACFRGCTPLTYSCGHLAIARLLETGRNEGVSQMPPTHPRSLQVLESVLYHAIRTNNLAMCQRAFVAGCPIDTGPGSTELATPLMTAIVQQTGVELVTWLIENGATVSTVYQKPYLAQFSTVLDAAIAHPKFNSAFPRLLMRFSEEGGDASNLPCNLLCRAITSRNIQVFYFLMNALGKYKLSSSPAKASTETYNRSEGLPSLNTSLINKTDDNFRDHPTPLHVAVRHRLHGAAELLLDEGAEVDKIDAYGRTPLHIAASLGDIRTALLLLNAGSCVSAHDYDDRTPLWYACVSGSCETIDLLIENGAKPNARLENYIDTSLLKPLLMSGLNLTRTKLFKTFLNEDFNICETDPSGVCLAHILLAGHPSHFAWLLAQDIHGFLPLQLDWPSFVINITPDLTMLIRRLKFLRRLLSNHQMMEILGIHCPGRHSLLCHAARYGADQAVADLLDIAVGVEYICNAHGTPLGAAASKGHTTVVKNLVRRGARISLRHEDIFKDGRHAETVRYPNIMSWILVGRHMEQLKLSANTSDLAGVAISGRRSGTAVVSLHMKREWQKSRNESMLEYAARRQLILKGLSGIVIHPANV